MRRFRSELAAAALAATLLLAGCADFSGIEAPRDHVTFIVNGEQTTVAMAGDISVELDGVPELTYTGPAGCTGGYFADAEADTYFRYTPRRAYFLRGSQLYTFDGPPRQAGGDILWHRSFGPDKITVLANCPLPSGG